ncbi:hypothetical protein AX774_g4405 [Zancudomyces culisetae]|uniref:Uncharacterized protein n=1 Tax=Zancudomyces culisetae TaxID=1213189 RepID=A0A1R1PME5_ZANCU|nr:hypothetical protein AX774_g4405 [Zancudomyces culisetae]|eukprot:OMH82134.1 hypothetical protein AX774_g4405 [Zancudomyces culisetae]
MIGDRTEPMDMGVEAKTKNKNKDKDKTRDKDENKNELNEYRRLKESLIDKKNRLSIISKLSEESGCFRESSISQSRTRDKRDISNTKYMDKTNFFHEHKQKIRVSYGKPEHPELKKKTEDTGEGRSVEEFCVSLEEVAQKNNEKGRTTISKADGNKLLQTTCFSCFKTTKNANVLNKVKKVGLKIFLMDFLRPKDENTSVDKDKEKQRQKAKEKNNKRYSTLTPNSLGRYCNGTLTCSRTRRMYHTVNFGNDNSTQRRRAKMDFFNDESNLDGVDRESESDETVSERRPITTTAKKCIYIHNNLGAEFHDHEGANTLRKSLAPNQDYGDDGIDSLSIFDHLEPLETNESEFSQDQKGIQIMTACFFMLLSEKNLTVALSCNEIGIFSPESGEIQNWNLFSEKYEEFVNKWGVIKC